MKVLSQNKSNILIYTFGLACVVYAPVFAQVLIGSFLVLWFLAVFTAPRTFKGRLHDRYVAELVKCGVVVQYDEYLAFLYGLVFSVVLSYHGILWAAVGWAAYIAFDIVEFRRAFVHWKAKGMPRKIT